MKIINSLDELRDSNFGQPDPRHGLNLLYWFSFEYTSINIKNQMKVKLQKPQSGAFGFCRFHNNEHLLPVQNVPYFEVGNLHDRGDELPVYVKQKYTHQMDESNKDRIIISLKDNTIEKVYVTEHMNQKKFNPDKTYEVSGSVIRQISRMGREQFLKQMQQSWCTIL
ncbi:uncharacterized protein Hap1MRO34_002786 [Clarias gariepinus]